MIDAKTPFSNVVPVVLTFVFLGFVYTCTKQKETKKIPVSDFFKTPKESFFKISPDGQYLSYLRSYNERQNICIRSLKTGAEQCLTSFSDVGVRDYFWTFNNDIVFSKDKLEGSDSYNLSTLNIRTKEIKEVLAMDSVRGRLIFRDQINPDCIVIGLNKRDPSSFDVYRLNVHTAKLKLYIKNPGNITEWFPDWQGKIRLAKASDGVNETILYRQSDEEAFRPIINNNFKNSVVPIIFTDKKNCFYALSNVNRDKAAVVVINGLTGKEERVVYENKQADITNSVASRLKKNLLYVSWDDEKPRKFFFSKTIASLFVEIERKLPGANIRILDRDSSEKHFVLNASSDRNPGTYYLYESVTRKISKIAELNPAIDSTLLCPMQPVNYKARDGFDLHGYLTLPINTSGRNLPLVVVPRTGLWGRNTWGYDAEIQFLANRGYAVFQPNFRGSKGFGKKFHQSGFREMGGKMQTDIEDGVKWLIKEGIIDEQRVGIYGGGFGGFSALYAVAKYPETYKCAAVSNALINFFTYLRDVPPYFKPQLSMMYEMVGNPEKDAGMFRGISPVFNASKIRSPLLIFQGAKDPTANLNETDHFVSEIQRQKVKVTYILKKNERQFFRSEHNKIEQYTRLEHFLETYLNAKH